MYNRYEPLTNETAKYIKDKSKHLKNLGLKYNFYTVMSNWLTLGMQTGFRLSERTQDHT